MTENTNSIPASAPASSYRESEIRLSMPELLGLIDCVNEVQALAAATLSLAVCERPVAEIDAVGFVAGHKSAALAETIEALRAGGAA